MSKQILILFVSFIIFGAESKPANLRPIFIGKLRFINPRLILKLTKNPLREETELQKSIQKPSKLGMYFNPKPLIWIFAQKIITSANEIHTLTLKTLQNFACINPIIFFSDLEVEKDVNVMMIP